MIIDFHTHIFPDRMAKKTIEFLEGEGNVKAYTDGTLYGLKKSMKDSNINISVVMPVVTKPDQFDTVNRFAADINGREGIISFGGIHPDTENYKEKLKKIQELGLPGIKLHPDYQNTFVDDPKMVRIIKYATELGLIVLLHAGVDIGLPNPVHCTPECAARMLSQLDRSDTRIVLAHTGGFSLWDEVEEYLVGQNVWFDISFSLGKISEEQFVRIVRNHGADRILFASDSPWDGQWETHEKLMKTNLTEEEFERILSGNAKDLLGLK